MLTKLAGGNTITHRWPLNIEEVHEIERDQYDLTDASLQVVYDLGAPTTGYCWVLSAITASFDVQPILPGALLVDSNAGANLYWIDWVGQTPAAVVGVPTAQGPYKFHFRPGIKFPVDEDISITWLGGDPACLLFLSWEVWQEELSVSP